MDSRKPRIAIVDDDESIRKSLRRLLTGSGFDVEVFASGTEFIASLETRSPDGLVLDMHMPELNGLDVQAWLATTGRRIPVLFITAHDDATLRAKALAGGAAAYLDKPVRKETLLAALYKAVGGTGAACGIDKETP
jgi:FixJ family two-component response regulator